MNSKFDIFISHSTKEKTLAYDICEFLESHNLRCWIAPRNIDAGKDYAESITEGIKACRICLLIFSEDSNKSKYVLREIERSVNYDLTLIPLKVDTAVPSPSLEFFTSSVQWIDAQKGSAYDYFKIVHERCCSYLGKDYTPHRETNNFLSKPTVNKFAVYVDGNLNNKFSLAVNSQTTVTIGRKSPSDVIIDVNIVSSIHAKIIQERNNTVYIVDMNSTNGTYLNGNKIQPGVTNLIKKSEIISLGAKRRVVISLID